INGNMQQIPYSSSVRFWLLCYNYEGKVLWRKVLSDSNPSLRRHPVNSYASPTPATDGAIVISFLGSEGLFCHNVDGDQKWKVSFGVLSFGYKQNQAFEWGAGSSPVIFAD